MLKLLFDVLDGFRYLRDSNAKGAVALLPGKVPQFRDCTSDSNLSTSRYHQLNQKRAILPVTDPK
jgi:hypothetical protein